MLFVVITGSLYGYTNVLLCINFSCSCNGYFNYRHFVLSRSFFRDLNVSQVILLEYNLTDKLIQNE